MKKIAVAIAVVALTLPFLFDVSSADTVLIQDSFDSFLLWETVDGSWTVTGGGYSGNGLQPTTTGTNIIRRAIPYIPPGTFQLGYKYHGTSIGYSVELLDTNGNVIYQLTGCNPLGGGWYDCFSVAFLLTISPAWLQITVEGDDWIFDDVFFAALNLNWTGDCIDQANLLTNSHFDTNYSGWNLISGSASVVDGELMLTGSIRQTVTIPDTVTTAWIVIHARSQVQGNAAFYWIMGSLPGGELVITDQTIVAVEELVFLGYEPPIVDFVMQSPDGVYVDDVWIVGLDTNQNITCDEPPPPIVGLEILPCYACPVPQTYDIGPWIVWLYCELQNLFYCALRIWLLEVVNVTAGLYDNVTALIGWLPAAALESLNWVAGGVNMAIDRQIDMYNSFKDYLEAISLVIVAIGGSTDESSWLGWLLDAVTFLVDGFAFIWDLFWLVWNGFEVLWTLIIELVSFVISGFFMAIRQMFELFIGLIDVIWQAFEAEAYQLDFLFEEGVPNTYESYQAQLYTVDSETQTYTALMWGMLLMDSWVVESGFSGWESVLVGLVALPTILWVMREWSGIIPDI